MRQALLDAKAKRIVKKDRFHTCGYIYTDGVVISGRETHRYKDKEFSNEFNLKFSRHIPIYITHKEYEGQNPIFQGRLVVHNPTLLLDGIKKVEIYYGNKTDKMEEKGFTCNTVSLTTESGMRISHDIFDFMSSDYTIQNGKKHSIDDCD